MPRCHQCKEPARPIDIVKGGEVVASGALCDGCFEEALDGAAVNKAEFEALLGMGVSREEANRIMIEKIHRGGRPS